MSPNRGAAATAVMFFSFFWLVQPCFATWKWQIGDFVSYTVYPPDQIAQSAQSSLKGNLDFRVFYNTAGDGHFIGLADFLREEEFNPSTSFTLILGTSSRWDPASALIYLGVDPRCPIPNASPLSSNPSSFFPGCVTLLDRLPLIPPGAAGFQDNPILFQARDEKGWHPDCQVGGRWDSLLTAGHRIGIVAKNARTSVWAESQQPDRLFEGLNTLATLVSDPDGITADFRVDGQVPGSRLSFSSEAVIHLSASGPEPLMRVQLIADGQVIWTAEPKTTTYEKRMLMPLGNLRYIRAEFLSSTYQTRTSPLFFSSEFNPDPVVTAIDELPFSYTLDGLLESVVYLPEASQARVLSEYLGEEETRFTLALALVNRPDILSSTLLESLSASPFPQVRLGAALTHVLRSDPSLPAHLVDLLNDSDSAIQSYAARMLLQFTPFQDNAVLRSGLSTVHPEARVYLVLAMDPSSSDRTLCTDLLRLTGDMSPDLASAARAKLVQMGNRNFKVIRALRDSAYTGHLASLEILGSIADARVADDVEKIYLDAGPGTLKNVSYRVLQRFYPDEGRYPDRPVIKDRGAAPLIDGIFATGEWAGAAHVDHFVDDVNTGKQYKEIEAWFSCDETQFRFAFALKRPDSLDVHHLEIALSTPIALMVPFVFTVPIRDHGEQPSDPSLRVQKSWANGNCYLEGSLSLTDLGLDPESPIPYLRLNASVITSSNRWSWTPTYGEPGNPQRFGDLNLQGTR